jgi:ssDNA-binding protein
MAEIDIAKIKLENVRLSYPQLWTPKAIEDGKEPKFSANFLLDNETHGKLLDQVDALTDRLALDFFKKKVTLKRRPVRDGNDDSVADKDGYGDGVSFIVASSKNRPAVVDRDPTIAISEADGKIYAGCYVNAVIRLFAYDHKVGGKGVSADLKCVQFVKDGESFGAGHVDPTQEFNNISDEQESGGSSSRSTRSTRGSSGGAKKATFNPDEF